MAVESITSKATRSMAKRIARFTFFGSPKRAYARLLSPSEETTRIPVLSPRKHVDWFNSRRSEVNSATSQSWQSLQERMEELRAGGSMRCFVLDRHGKVIEHGQVHRKTDLCCAHGLQARDLRKIDSVAPIPAILVRKGCILVNILHIRALITSEYITIFETVDAFRSDYGYAERVFIDTLARHLRQTETSNTLPFEHRCLEAILATASKTLETEVLELRSQVEHLLEDLERNIVPSKLRLLLTYSKKVAISHRRAVQVQDAVDEVLQADDDLDGLHLTSPRSLDLGIDHAEVEMLLESYSRQIEETVNEIDSLAQNVAQTKEVIELILDSSRNALLALDLKANIATLGLGSGALIAGLFGMNLATKLEEHPHAFWMASGGSVALAVLVAMLGIRRLHKLRQVGLGGSWAECTTAPHLNASTIKMERKLQRLERTKSYSHLE